MNLIEARALRKRYGTVTALDGFDLVLPPGRITGLIGPNGSGKTTAIKSILGLTHADAGSIRVIDRDPARQRAAIMARTGYIADVGTLPRWMRVAQLLTFVAGVHPHFDRQAAERELARTDIRADSRIRALSKGMNVQLHLAIILAMQADLLVLDEPTLGLDILHRQHFYDRLMNEYWSPARSILITTHEVREIEHLLTDVVLIHRGRTLFAAPMAEVATRFCKVTVGVDAIAGARALGPLHERQTPAGIEMMFSQTDRTILDALGVVAAPSLPELFVALVESAEAPHP